MQVSSEESVFDVIESTLGVVAGGSVVLAAIAVVSVFINSFF